MKTNGPRNVTNNAGPYTRESAFKLSSPPETTQHILSDDISLPSALT